MISSTVYSGAASFQSESVDAAPLPDPDVPDPEEESVSLASDDDPSVDDDVLLEAWRASIQLRPAIVRSENRRGFFDATNHLRKAQKR
jgi:hypothetical protein